jgi:D-beta-D-heptose 7-phosphate kinase/D-beta-D-heptose 1-phosphate adenosyltransferase
LLGRVIRAARQRGLPVLVDPARISDYSRYQGATLVKPNRRQAELATGRTIRSPADALDAGRELVQRYGFEAVVVTLDGEGMAVVTADGTVEHVPTKPRQVCDITGAGDMALAMLGVCLASGVTESKGRKVEEVEESETPEIEESKGRNVEESRTRRGLGFGRDTKFWPEGRMSLRRAVELANVAAGLEVERLGVVPVTRAEIAAALRHSEARASSWDASPNRPAWDGSPNRPGSTWDGSPSRPGRIGNPAHRPAASSGRNRKLVTLDEMASLAAAYRRDGKTVVFTNGCFDLLHVGHVSYLEEAAALGDVLVVGLNSDASVRRLKGPERPIVAERDRAALLAALGCVDHVVLFEEDTPHRLLEAIRPDVLVKGGTYTVDQIVGHEIVERYGGRVCATGTQPGVSTTKLVADIRRPLAAVSARA